MRWLWIIAGLLAGCGGAATGEPPEEEVTATWTSGDDAPLEEPDEAER